VADRSPFAEDQAAHQVARSLGFTIARRYEAIDVYDEKALAEGGFLSKKPKPDFGRIAEALRSGHEVPGARFRTMEYVLRPAVSDED
jgi:hypothetical protein